MRVISSQFFSGTKEMTRARIMRVNSRQKRVNQIRASFVKDARRQMRVDTRSLAGALFYPSRLGKISGMSVIGRNMDSFWFLSKHSSSHHRHLHILVLEPAVVAVCLQMMTMRELDIWPMDIMSVRRIETILMII